MAGPTRTARPSDRAAGRASRPPPRHGYLHGNAGMRTIRRSLGLLGTIAALCSDASSEGARRGPESDPRRAHRTFRAHRSSPPRKRRRRRLTRGVSLTAAAASHSRRVTAAALWPCRPVGRLCAQREPCAGIAAAWTPVPSGASRAGGPSPAAVGHTALGASSNPSRSGRRVCPS